MYACLKFELFAMLIFYYGMSLILSFGVGGIKFLDPCNARHPLLYGMSLDFRLRCNKYGSIKFSTCVIPAHILGCS